MSKRSPRVSDLLLERYLLEDLPEETRRRVEEALEREPALRARLEALEEENRDFWARHDPRQAAHLLAARLALDEPRPRQPGRWLLVAAPSFALAGLAVVALRVLAPPPPEQGEEDRSRRAEEAPVRIPEAVEFRDEAAEARRARVAERFEKLGEGARPSDLLEGSAGKVSREPPASARLLGSTGAPGTGTTATQVDDGRLSGEPPARPSSAARRKRSLAPVSAARPGAPRHGIRLLGPDGRPLGSRGVVVAGQRLRLVLDSVPESALVAVVGWRPEASPHVYHLGSARARLDVRPPPVERPVVERITVVWVKEPADRARLRAWLEGRSHPSVPPPAFASGSSRRFVLMVRPGGPSEAPPGGQTPHSTQ